MITLDTNILARILLNDDPIHSPMARKFIIKSTQSQTLYLSPFVVMELVWLLQKNGWKRERIVKSVIAFMETKNILTGEGGTVENALKAYNHGKADFADYLILADSIQHGAREIATFDTVFAKEDACHHPEHWL